MYILNYLTKERRSFRELIEEVQRDDNEISNATPKDTEHQSQF